MCCDSAEIGTAYYHNTKENSDHDLLPVRHKPYTQTHFYIFGIDAIASVKLHLG